MLTLGMMLLSTIFSLMLCVEASAQTGPGEASPTPTPQPSPSPAAKAKKKQTTSSTTTTTPAERNAQPARTNRANASNRNANSGAHTASPAEIEFWDTIKNSTNPEDFRAYLKKYPNGEFVDLAKNRLESLTANTHSSTAQPSTTNPPASSSPPNNSNAETPAANPAAVTWTLDLGRSDLIESLRDVRSMEITEAHGAGKISVQIHTVFNPNVRPERTESYAAILDGNEIRTNLIITDSNGVRKIPATIKAKVLKSDVIEFVIHREVNTQADTMVTDTERWQFSADNRTLTIHRKRETPQGNFDYVMIFNRR